MSDYEYDGDDLNDYHELATRSGSNTATAASLSNFVGMSSYATYPTGYGYAYGFNRGYERNGTNLSSIVSWIGCRPRGTLRVSFTSPGYVDLKAHSTGFQYSINGASYVAFSIGGVIAYRLLGKFVGGGGGGCGSNTSFSGGGGGGGGSAIGWIGLDLTTAVRIYIGAGGAGGIAGYNPGSNGGNTYVSGNTVIAYGGNGATNYAAASGGGASGSRLIGSKNGGNGGKGYISAASVGVDGFDTVNQNVTVDPESHYINLPAGSAGAFISNWGGGVGGGGSNGGTGGRTQDTSFVGVNGVNEGGGSGARISAAYAGGAGGAGRLDVYY